MSRQKEQVMPVRILPNTASTANYCNRVEHARKSNSACETVVVPIKAGPQQAEERAATRRRRCS